MRTGLRSNRSTPTHALWYLSLPDNDVFSRSTLKAWGGRVDPSFTMSNQLSADALQLEFCCFHSIARGWPAEPELAAAEPAFAQWASAWRRPSSLRRAKAGGARRDRTDDLMLAKHALYQLSYGPEGSILAPAELVGPDRLELSTLRLSGVRSNHLSYGPLGGLAHTGAPAISWSPMGSRSRPDA